MSFSSATFAAKDPTASLMLSPTTTLPGVLMFQGTGSDVGKSVLCAGLCRLFSKRGLRVRPFKPQNMSNNAAVTPEGGEIGRAQALQARACGVSPHVDMNPVLLKPQSEIGAQLIVQGQVRGTARAGEYQALKPGLMPAVLDSFERLRAHADLIIVEGAGSAAEVNLRAGDIANMGFAQATRSPVVLIGDIDRGGVIASIVGTWSLLPEDERALLAGYVINKFRGDLSLFDDGLRMITEHTALPSLGVVPYLPITAKLPAEDAMALQAAERSPARVGTTPRIKIAVPVLPRIANFDDFDPLKAESDLVVEFVHAGQALPGDAHLIVLPGSKSTLADLAFLRAQCWDQDLFAHRRRGGKILGICAGFQMLGNSVTDPGGIEGNAGSAQGLGLIDVQTELGPRKTLTLRRGHHVDSDSSVEGYEMHLGHTFGQGLSRPMLSLEGQVHGAVSPDGQISGCYLHGLFTSDSFRAALLQSLASTATGRRESSYDAGVERALDDLALALETHLNVEQLLAIAQLGSTPQGFPPGTGDGDTHEQHTRGKIEA